MEVDLVAYGKATVSKIYLQTVIFALIHFNAINISLNAFR